MPPLDPQAKALAQAIREAEGFKGDPNIKGESGEWGAYQWTPATWDAYSKEAGVNAVFGTATLEQQNEVAYKKIKQWKDAGYNPGQIASMWNAGVGKPNAYLEGHKGVNKFGVEYDTPDYAERVATSYHRLKGQIQDVTPEQLAPQGGSLMSNLGENLAGRVQDIADTFQQPNLARGVLRSAGAVAGGIGDITGTILSAVTPDFIEKPVMGALGDVVGGALNTETGRGLVTAYESLDPELRKDIGAVGNIASLVPIGKGVSLGAGAVKGAVPTAVRVAAKTEGVVGDAARRSLVKEAIDIVSPKPTQKVSKTGIKAGRGESGGLFTPSTVAPDEKTLRAAEAAAGIVKKGNTGIQNANAVRDEIGNIAEKLKTDLKNMEVAPILQKEEMDDLLERSLREIGENPTMVGDAARSAELILNKFKSFLPRGDVTAYDLLEARKRLDKWMDTQTVSNVFNPNYETAKTVALRSIRQGANDLVATKAPDVAVKEMLRRQSALYDALENISAKAAQEVGRTGLDRFMRRHPRTTGLVGAGAGAVLTGLGIGTVPNLLGSEK